MPFFSFRPDASISLRHFRVELAPPQTRTSPIKAYGSSSESLATVATSVGSVNEGSRLSVLASLPRRCFHQAVPFPTPRLPRLGSPAFQQYYETAKTPAAPHPHSVRHVALGYLGLASLSLRWTLSHRPPAWMLFRRWHPLRLWSQGRKRVSHVPREPYCAFALFSDPGRTSAPRPYRRSGAAPAVQTTKAPATGSLSRLHHTALALAVYASCRHLLTTMQNSLPGVANRSGWDWLPTEFR